ncbi:hypothetical protein BH23ACT2_BH23ACT2_28380 [soil metagenome]
MKTCRACGRTVATVTTGLLCRSCAPVMGGAHDASRAVATWAARAGLTGVAVGFETDDATGSARITFAFDPPTEEIPNV